MSQTTKPTKAVPSWHAEAIGLVRANFNHIHTAFLSASRRAVWLGLFLNYIKERGKKDGSIPHGQFRPFLQTNFPDTSISQAAVYMAIGRGVAEKAKLQISGNRTFATLANPEQLPPAVEKLIAGKDQQALFLEFKQAEEDDEGNLNPKRGRRKGQGGNSAEHLAAIRAAEEKARIENLELEAKDFAEWFLKNCGPEGVGKISDKAFLKFCDAIQTGWEFCSHLRAARSKKGAQ